MSGIIVRVNRPMNKDRLRMGIILIAVFFAYLSIHPLLTAWVGSLTEVYAPIKIWKDVLIGFVLIIATIYGSVNKHVRKKVLKDTIIRLLVAYVTLSFIIFMLNQSYVDESGYAGLIFNVRFVALFFIIRVFMYGFAREGNQIRYSFSVLAKSTIIVAVLVALFGIAQALVLPGDFMVRFGYDGVNTISPISTIDDNEDARRAFSTLRGPNEFGAYLIIPILLALESLLRTRKWLYGVGVVVMTMGLYFSHSRSALIGLLVALSIFASLWVSKKLSRHMFTLGISGVGALLAIGLFITVNYAPARLVVFHSSPEDGSLVEGSTFDHFKASLDGIGDVVAHPFGRGVGEAGPASFYQTDGDKPRIAENYYTQIAQEVGIIGLLLFIAAVVVGLRQILAMKSVIYSKSFFAGFLGVSVVALFLHTWADDPVAYIAWGLFAVMLANNRRASSSANNEE